MPVGKTILLVVSLLAIMGIFYQYTYSGYDGPFYIEEPTQKNLYPVETITIEGERGPVELDLLATYKVNAIVKNIADYTSDYTSQISPRDFALAWADINIPSIDKHVTYSQKNRWYYFTVVKNNKADVHYVDRNSANTHIIPSSEYIADLVAKVEPDDYITLEGYLVNANFKDGYWNTSLTREDTGDGSCEILYVTSVVFND